MLSVVVNESVQLHSSFELSRDEVIGPRAKVDTATDMPCNILSLFLTFGGLLSKLFRIKLHERSFRITGQLNNVFLVLFLYKCKGIGKVFITCIKFFMYVGFFFC